TCSCGIYGCDQEVGGGDGGCGEGPWWNGIHQLIDIYPGRGVLAGSPCRLVPTTGASRECCRCGRCLEARASAGRPSSPFGTAVRGHGSWRGATECAARGAT